MEKIKQGISDYLSPILITIVGFFIVQTLFQIKEDIKALHNRNIDRDEWVRDWIEKWQPSIYWAKQQMEKGQGTNKE